MNYNKIKKIITSFFSHSTLPFFNNFVLKNELRNYKTKKELYSAYKLSFSPKHLMEEEKLQVLRKVYDDVESLYHTLSPLINIGIPITIELVGGAVRDYILGKHDEISDLDIFVSYTVPTGERYSTGDELRKVLLEMIPEDKRAEYLEGSDDITFIISKAMLYLFSTKDNNLVHQSFSHSEKYKETFYGQNLINSLEAIIKIENKNGNYPIDVLVSLYEREKLFESMDLNICKTGICFFDNRQSNRGLPDYDLVFPQFNKLVERFYTTPEFLADLADKKITFDNFYKTEQQVEYTLSRHLPKVMLKYPDYPVVLDKKDDTLEIAIKSTVIHTKLENNLEKSYSKPRVRKI